MAAWKALPDELDPDVRAFTERLRRLIDRSGLGVVAVAERTGHDRATWDAYLRGERPVPRGAAVALAEVTGTDVAGLAAEWEHADRAWKRQRGTAAGPVGPGDGGDERTMQFRRVDAERAPIRTPGGTPVGGIPGGTPGGTPAGMSGPSVGRSGTPAGMSGPSVGAGARAPAASRSKTALLYAAGIGGAALVVVAALLLVDLGGGGADDGRAAPPTTTVTTPATPTGLPPGVRCAGTGCAGKDPEAMGCGGPLAATVASAHLGTVQVEVRHSATCRAAWARITGAAPGDTVSVEAAGATRTATPDPGADTDAYTAMVAVEEATDARACITRTDGGEECTAN
ncbi:DUF2690 domain-containing protein [Streptomyces sp. NPDC003327]